MLRDILDTILLVVLGLFWLNLVIIIVIITISIIF